MNATTHATTNGGPQATTGRAWQEAPARGESGTSAERHRVRLELRHGLRHGPRAGRGVL